MLNECKHECHTRGMTVTPGLHLILMYLGPDQGSGIFTRGPSIMLVRYQG